MTTKIKYRLLNELIDEVYEKDSWEEAAERAVDLGVGRWDNTHEFSIDHPWRIKAVRVDE